MIEIYQTIQNLLVPILFTISAIAIIFFVSTSLRLFECRKSLKNELFFNKVSAQTIDDYDNQIKLQECEIKERKKAFEDSCNRIKELEIQKEGVVSQVMDLVGKCKLLELCTQHNLDQIAYWKERALHYKHTKKVVDSEWWECQTSLQYDYFEVGKTYKESTSERKVDGMLFLICTDGDKIPFLVEKKYFKPVQS